MVPVQWYLLLAAVLFGVGLVGVLVKRPEIGGRRLSVGNTLL